MELVHEKVNLGSAWVQTVFVSEAHLVVRVIQPPQSGGQVLVSGPRWSYAPRPSCAFGDYQRDVVGLFMRAESSSLIGNGDQQLRQG